jgi:hypothetical protein
MGLAGNNNVNQPDFLTTDGHGLTRMRDISKYDVEELQNSGGRHLLRLVLRSASGIRVHQCSSVVKLSLLVKI